jgi:hypothetical protein
VSESLKRRVTDLFQRESADANSRPSGVVTEGRRELIAGEVFQQMPPSVHSGRRFRSLVLMIAATERWREVCGWLRRNAARRAPSEVSKSHR